MGTTVTLDGIIAHLRDPCAQHLVARDQIEYQLRRYAGRVSIAMEAAATTHCQFCFNAPPVEEHFVVPCLGGFLAMGESGLVVLFPVGKFLDGIETRHGHHTDVAQVGAAGAAQVGVAETLDERITVMVAGTAVPVVLARVGAQLDHTERIGCTRESMTVEIGSDHRVHQVGIFSAQHAGGQQERQASRQDEENQKLFHNM